MKLKFIHPSSRIFKSKLPLVIGYFGAIHMMHYQILKHYHDFNVLTFREFEAKKESKIYSFKERMRGISRFEPHKIYVYDITKNNISADDFCKKILLKIKPTEIMIGADFKFGSDQKSFEYLRKYFKVRVQNYNANISTTIIKKYLKEHNMEYANGLLYEPYHYASRWVGGKKRGRQVGFRTINLKWSDNLLVPHGVYISRTTIGSNTYNSLTFVGASKTFDLVKPTIETHILHKKIRYSSLFNVLNKKKIRVDFLEYLRPVGSYRGATGLREQIEKDIEKADKFFNPDNK